MMPNIESLLEQLQKDASPSKAFEQRLLSRLQRRHVMMQSEEKLPLWRRFSEMFGLHFFTMLGKRSFSALMAAFFVVSTSGISAYAYTSNNVTRDSVLYPVKRTLESVEKVFISTPEATVQFHLKMMNRRLAEVWHISQVRGVADEATLKDFSNEFDQGVTVAAALPVPAQREIFFKRLESVLDSQEKILALPVLLPTVTAPVASPAIDAPVEKLPRALPVVLPAERSRFENRAFPYLEAIQQRLEEARRGIAEERAQLDPIRTVIPGPLPVDSAPLREEIREQHEVIPENQENRKEDRKKETKNSPREQPVEKILNLVIIPDGPRIEILEKLNVSLPLQPITSEPILRHEIDGLRIKIVDEKKVSDEKEVVKEATVDADVDSGPRLFIEEVKVSEELKKVR